MLSLRTSLVGVPLAVFAICLLLNESAAAAKSPLPKTLFPSSPSTSSSTASNRHQAHHHRYNQHFHPHHHLHPNHRNRPQQRPTTAIKPTIPAHKSTTAIMRGDQPPQAASLFGDADSAASDIDDDLLADPLIYTLRQRPVGSHVESALYETEHRGAYRPPEKEHACHKSSCYPATGNLLIGRENRLQASSTCGLHRRERFCIVSHLEEKKCFLCDTRPETRDDPQLNHRIGQITYKQSPGTREHSWWQSENGRENVTVQLDLEAEFHFTHLIIVFATFRPAAMLIERSYDFGKTWHVYKYFAHNCAQSFPGVPLQSRNITDVVCDHRYSGVEPSKNGEVIFRVLPPNMNIENPYAAHVQNMLKMTNLRINFTKLHNLGDTLLDDRLEIQEKYYYAISNMVVRGSCSCYGHASKCLPLDGVHNNKLDMVHGRCECTHNTKGLNCEECEDFYNDLPWKPALGKQSNACKVCNCNNHATSCHFDAAVYENSGRVSGGVCDNCQHNTQGQHCQECIPFFYRDPEVDIQSPYVCRPCDCDSVGSLDEGICDSITDAESGIVAGACHCKAHVAGRRCDTCKDGYWNLDERNPEGCELCTCNILGTHNNSGCNMHTGECTCKRHVRGKECNQCLEQTYGLSESADGCSLCDCDAGGSLDNHCDVITGQCKCRNYMTGRRCDAPKQNYFIPALGQIHEAEDAEDCEDRGFGSKCTKVVGEWSYDRRPEFTGSGYMRGSEGTSLTITVDDVPRTMPYDIVLRYQSQRPGDWEDARITVVRPEPYAAEGVCGASHPSNEQNVRFRIPERETSTVALPEVCLEQGKVYRFKIYLYQQRINDPDPNAQIYIDSLTLIPRIEATTIFGNSPPGEIRLNTYRQLRCNETYYRVNNDPQLADPCDDLYKTASVVLFDGAAACDCNPTGSLTKKCDTYGGLCQCKPNVVGRQCDRCAPSTYGFGPEGCQKCDCDNIGALDRECNQITGQCSCRPNTYGRVCDQCQPGFWNFNDCKQCQCNGHATTCDTRTGECHNCGDFTTGAQCDRCIEGYYGDPALGSVVGCRPCLCPGTMASNHTHADYCQLESHTLDMVCYCQEGYKETRCDQCADNYFGNPEVPGGSCERCDCNGNVDLNRRGNCDARTGECAQCLFETAGAHCEYCRDGFHGDALAQDCRECECDILGTNGTIKHCDRYTGQCPCLKNVEGPLCDLCVENHWKIASGEGCETCDCDPVGAEREQCNPYTGECVCKPGFGGRQCNQCQRNYWGDPNVQCHACDCDHYGSASQQCDRATGKCVCLTGMGGYKCDQCDRGYEGEAPHCSACGECFDNWDLILNDLQAETTRVIGQAKQIKMLGATGAYTKEFDAMEQKLGFIQHLLDNTTVNAQDITELEVEVGNLREQLAGSLERLQESENTLENVYSSANLVNVGLDELRNRSAGIQAFAHDLKTNATQLQEANIEGALNLTRESWLRADELRAQDNQTDGVFSTAEKQCRRTEALVAQKHGEFEQLQQKNEEYLDAYQAELATLERQVPDLNEQMCDKRGDPCDALCGGAGCDHCGGLSCEKGALTKAERALSYVHDVERTIKQNDGVAEDLIRSLSHVKQNASEAVRNATAAYLEAQSFLNETRRCTDEARDLVKNLSEAYNSDVASAAKIKQLAEDTLALKLELDRDEIKKLASEINETVEQLDNVDTIISTTRHDLHSVKELKKQAEEAKSRADVVLKEAINVTQALDDADKAQALANEAIEVAKNNIVLADSDLKQIDGQTGEAQAKATETADKVNELSNQLNEIQKTFQRNDIDASGIKREADVVRDAASNAHELATQLRDNYTKANSSLTEKAATSESARQRARQLLQRASKIAGVTTTKLRELETMMEVHRLNNQDLEGLKGKVDGLNVQMSEYLNEIQANAARYRICT